MTGIFGEKKKRLHIFIPESLEEDVRDFVAATYHRYERGQISSVVIQALRFYLDPKTQSTHAQIRNSTKYSNHRYDVLFAQIKNYLPPKYRYEGFTGKVIPEKHINEAISALRDIHDHRSIRDWRSRLEMGGYIERAGLDSRFKQFKILKDVDIQTPTQNKGEVSS
jgi:hypothetical protein